MSSKVICHTPIVGVKFYLHISSTSSVVSRPFEVLLHNANPSVAWNKGVMVRVEPEEGVSGAEKALFVTVNHGLCRTRVNLDYVNKHVINNLNLTPSNLSGLPICEIAAVRINREEEICSYPIQNK